MVATARNQSLIRVIMPASEPVSIDEAKLYLRVTGSNEDTIISDLIAVARISAENVLKKSLITQSWKLSIDGQWPVFSPSIKDAQVAATLSDDDNRNNSIVRLPMGPVTSVTSVVAFQQDGSNQALATSNYFLNAPKNELIFIDPPAALRLENTYVAGYGDASSVPKPIKLGILTHIASLYDNRGDGNLPKQSVELYQPFREVLL